MTVLRNGNQWDRSNVVFRGGKLLCYDKRHATPEMEYIDYGAFAVSARPRGADTTGRQFSIWPT